MTTKSLGKLKVFSGAAVVRGDSKQVSVMVAATSIKNVVEALAAHGIFESAGRISSHWYKMANAEDTALATSVPGQVFATSAFSGKDYKPLPKFDLDAEDAEVAALRETGKLNGPSL